MNHLHLPAGKNWQPTPEAAASTEAYVAGLFSGPGEVVWEVSSGFCDQVTLIDAELTMARLGSSLHGGTAFRTGEPLPGRGGSARRGQRLLEGTSLR